MSPPFPGEDALRRSKITGQGTTIRQGMKKSFSRVRDMVSESPNRPTPVAVLRYSLHLITNRLRRLARYPYPSTARDSYHYIQVRNSSKSELDTDCRMGRRRRVCLETLSIDRHRQRERREREEDVAVGRSVGQGRKQMRPNRSPLARPPCLGMRGEEGREPEEDAEK